jgi:adenosine deaminase
MTDIALETFVRGLPKAELHMHIEGSLEPELMFELAERNGVVLPFKTVDEIRAAYAFSNLQDFLDIYYQGAGVLLTARPTSRTWPWPISAAWRPTAGPTPRSSSTPRPTPTAAWRSAR